MAKPKTKETRKNVNFTCTEAIIPVTKIPYKNSDRSVCMTAICDRYLIWITHVEFGKDISTNGKVL